METVEVAATQQDARKAVFELLSFMHLDPHMESELLETPRRVVELYEEFSQPWDPQVLLREFESPLTDGLIIQQHIPFRGMCPHHLLPFFGEAAIGYLPRKKVLGLSKLARLVDAVGTERPNKQETITQKIADTLSETMECNGVMVVTVAIHTCMAVRGINMPSCRSTVSVAKGQLLLNQGARQEFLALLTPNAF